MKDNLCVGHSESRQASLYLSVHQLETLSGGCGQEHSMFLISKVSFTQGTTSKVTVLLSVLDRVEVRTATLTFTGVAVEHARSEKQVFTDLETFYTKRTMDFTDILACVQKLLSSIQSSAFKANPSNKPLDLLGVETNGFNYTLRPYFTLEEVNQKTGLKRSEEKLSVTMLFVTNQSACGVVNLYIVVEGEKKELSTIRLRVQLKEGHNKKDILNRFEFLTEEYSKHGKPTKLETITLLLNKVGCVFESGSVSYYNKAMLKIRKEAELGVTSE